jgi:hypothetical protein
MYTEGEKRKSTGEAAEMDSGRNRNTKRRRRIRREITKRK